MRSHEHGDYGIDASTSLRHIGDGEVEITYFVDDDRKAGGAYVTTRGRVRRVDPIEGIVQFMDRSEVKITDIYGVEFVEEGG